MLTPTQQQQNIINLAGQSNNIVIEARAGASKTTTCEMIANKVVKPSLYIAFNKDIASEAEGRFPSHVTCKTIHSLAYKEIIKFPKSKMGQKLQANLDINDIREVAPYKYNSEEEITFLLSVKETVILYCQSADIEIIEKHIPETLEADEEFIKNILETARIYWAAITDPNTTYTISHDIYLKLYQLYEPCLADYEVIYLDEFQDTNQICMSLFFNQKHAQLIAVGDPYQSIYAFRGAVNAFNYVPASFTRATLTDSFRFTPEIASLAGKVINLLGEEAEINGLATKKPITNKAVICRTNIGVLKEIMFAANNGKKVYSNINLKETFAKLFHIEAVSIGNEPKYPVKDFKYLKKYEDIIKAANSDQDIKSLLDIMGFLRQKKLSVYGFKKIIEDTLVSKESLASLTVSTCHKSKGLQWSSVEVSSDFCKIPKDGTIESWLAGLDSQEINLIYIAITRGMFEVILPEVLEIILAEPEKWLAKAETIRKLVKINPMLCLV
jgi:superfamily I DNA/RNA helicase